MKFRYNKPLEVGAEIAIQDENGSWMPGKVVPTGFPDPAKQVVVVQLTFVGVEDNYEGPIPNPS